MPKSPQTPIMSHLPLGRVWGNDRRVQQTPTRGLPGAQTPCPQEAPSGTPTNVLFGSGNYNQCAEKPAGLCDDPPWERVGSKTAAPVKEGYHRAYLPGGRKVLTGAKTSKGASRQRKSMCKGPGGCKVLQLQLQALLLIITLSQLTLAENAMDHAPCPQLYV